MRRAGPGILAFMLAAGLFATAWPGQVASNDPGADSGDGSTVAMAVAASSTDRVIVRWIRGVPPGGPGQALESIRGAIGAQARFLRTTGSGASVVEIGGPMGGRAIEILSRLERLAGVESVEPDLRTTADALPDDPRAAELWGLLGPDDGSAFGIDVLPAWSTATGVGVVVAVVDTGLVSHPDLAGQIVAGYDMVADVSMANDGNGRDADASDPGDWCGDGRSSWHGTHVAGTIAAMANNGEGVFGGAPGVKIQPVRVLGRCGGYASDVADGIRWAAGGSVPGVPSNATPAAIINASLSASATTACLPEFASAIADARARGAIVVVSAGNAAVDASSFSPANCPGAVTVAASDEGGRRASFSNHGPLVDMAGPGEAVLSTVNAGTTTPLAGGSYAHMSGTSMSAPHVASTAAIVRSAHSALSNDAVELSLESTATPFGPDGSDSSCGVVDCGSGIVNARAAIQRLAGADPVVGRVTTSVAYPLPGASFTARALTVLPVGVAAAEVRVGGGSWQAMSAADGQFGGSQEWVTRSVTAPSTEGTHTICVRARSAGGSFGAAACTSVLVDAAAPTVSSPTLTTAAAPDTSIGLSAALSDPNGIVAAEFRIDGGPWIRLSPSDGAFDEPNEVAVTRFGQKVRAVEAGGPSCAILDDGTARCWGPNTYGVLGDGTGQDRYTPVDPGLAGVVQISQGLGHVCALLEEGTVRCWGYNGGGSVGDGSWTDRWSPTPVAGLTDVVSIASAHLHTCALRSDGTVWCWGAGHGLGIGTTTSRNTAGPVTGLTGVAAISGGGGSFGSTCALLESGSAYCWGDNNNGSLGDGTTTNSGSPVRVSGLEDGVALSDMQHCATRADGSIWCWGANGYGQLGDGTTTATRSVPTELTVMSGVQWTASGDGHRCGVRSDGSVECWGRNLDYELGDGTWQSRAHPAPVLNVPRVLHLSGGYQTTCAVVPDRTARCWGLNDHGRLGDGTNAVRTAPVKVVGLGPLPGGAHTICVRATDAAQRTSSGQACSSVTVAGPTPTPTPTPKPTPTPTPTPKPTPTPTPTPTNPFVDIDSSKFVSDILWLYHRGITVGCAPDRFCPKGLVTRAQMATFLVRALDLPMVSRDYFTDDAGNRHEKNINALAAARVTVGCAPGRYCPDGVVTRAQMATFLVRALDLPATARDYFTDDAGNRHEANINALAAAGVTRGCSSTTYCPNGSVTREQMAAFLHRGLTR